MSFLVDIVVYMNTKEENNGVHYMLLQKGSIPYVYQ